MAKASEPEPASERQYEATVSAARRGRKRRFCSAEAQRNKALLQMVFWTSTITPAEGSTADSSSTARIDWKNEPPCPPYSSGISMPIRPISKNWWMRSLRKTPASSIARTWGRISSRANLRTVVWKSSSSSVSAVRGRGAASVMGVASILLLYRRPFTRAGDDLTGNVSYGGGGCAGEEAGCSQNWPPHKTAAG